MNETCFGHYLTMVEQYEKAGNEDQVTKYLGKLEKLEDPAEEQVVPTAPCQFAARTVATSDDNKDDNDDGRADDSSSSS
jgi:hypothetical protein